MQTNCPHCGKEVHNILQEVKIESEKRGLTMNIEKIKVLTFTTNKETPRCVIK